MPKKIDEIKEDIQKIMDDIRPVIAADIRKLLEEKNIFDELRKNLVYIASLLSEHHYEDETELAETLRKYFEELKGMEKQFELDLKEEEKILIGIKVQLTSWISIVNQILEKEISSKEKSALLQLSDCLTEGINSINRIWGIEGELCKLLRSKNSSNEILDKIEELLGNNKNSGLLHLIAVLEYLEKFQKPKQYASEMHLVPVDAIIKGIDTTGLPTLQQIASNINATQTKMHIYFPNLQKFGNKKGMLRSTGYVDILIRILRHVSEITQYFKNQIIVDLGMGSSAEGYRIAIEYGAKAYIGVELSPTAASSSCRILNSDVWSDVPATIINEDMLTFLRRLPANSVSLVGWGIDLDIIDDVNYLRAIAKQTGRVLHPEGIFVSQGCLHASGKDIKIQECSIQSERVRVYFKNAKLKEGMIK